MEKLDIKVRKSAKGGFIEGSFFVKQLDFDECIALHEKSGDDGNARLVQMCLVKADGEPVFKPQQVNLIKDRLSGVDYMCVLITCNELNDFAKIGQLADKYAKNSESVPNSN